MLDPRPGYADTGPVAAVVADCADPVFLARFWAEAAGWIVHERGEALASLRSPLGTGPHLELLRVPGAKAVKNRIHLDVRPYPGGDQRAEVGRLRKHGARRADVGQGEVPWVVMSDPEGAEFCVLTPAEGARVARVGGPDEQSARRRDRRRRDGGGQVGPPGRPVASS